MATSSPDDALEPDNDIYQPQKHDHLPNDYSTPASPPDDVSPKSEHDYPAEDTNLDSGEVYDAGSITASGTDANAEEGPEEARTLEELDEAGEMYDDNDQR